MSSPMVRSLMLLAIASILAALGCSSKDSQQNLSGTQSPSGPVVAAQPPPPPLSPTAASPPPAPSPPAPQAATPGVYTLAIVGSSTVTGPVYQYIFPPLEVVALDSLGHPVDGVYVQFEDATVRTLGLGTDTTGLGSFVNTTSANPSDFPSTAPGTGRAGAVAGPTLYAPASTTVTCRAIRGVNGIPIVSCNTVTFTVIGQ